MDFKPTEFHERATVIDPDNIPVLENVAVKILWHQIWMIHPEKDAAFVLRDNPVLIASTLLNFTVDYKGIIWAVNGFSYHNAGSIILLSCTPT